MRTAFFAEYFSLRGHNVSVVGVFSATTLRKAGVSRSNQIRVINMIPTLMTSGIFSLILNLISSTLASFFAIIFARPEIVIISVPQGETGLGSYVAGKFLRRKLVIDYRDEWEDYAIGIATCPIHKKFYKFLKSLMTRCYTKSDLLVTVSEALTTSLLQRGITAAKVISNGADLNLFKQYDKEVLRSKFGLQKNDFVFVYSGGIGVYYKLDIVIKALKKIMNDAKNVKLILVGYGNDVNRVLNLARDLDLLDRVFYLGVKTDQLELAQVLSASDIGIVPFDSNPLWKNALPAKAMEYFACGLPVLATVYTDSILGKIIREHNIGLISDPENIDALAGNMDRLYKDRLYSNEAGRRAMSLAKERFDRSNIAKDFLGMLTGI
jgi:glycosyltransferase involved in cell wall biosynthesis